MEPMREWDYVEHKPSATIESHINEKRMAIADAFDVVPKNIIAVSAHEKYNLSVLMETIINRLPDQKKITVLRQATDDVITDEAKDDATKGFWNYIWEGVRTVLPMIIPEVDVIITLGKKLLSFLRW